MKRIDAIIPQSKMSDAFSALKELNIGGFTYFDSKGRGVNPPATVHSGRGTSLYTPEFNPNLTIFTVVDDSLVEQPFCCFQENVFCFKVIIHILHFNCLFFGIIYRLAYKQGGAGKGS